MGKIAGRRSVLVAGVTSLLLACSQETMAPLPPSGNSWKDAVGSRLITFGDGGAGLIWNDPTVLKEGDRYRMWLSGGEPSANPVVKIYTATSADGLQWDIQATPLVEPGPSGSWDSHRIETPSVVKVGATYHMYYSGGDAAAVQGGRYKLGHATSTDGLSWVKDPANPILSYHADSDPQHWGFYTTAEPGVAYDAARKTFFLYYTTFKARPGYEGDLGGMQGIALATSRDGSSFQNHDPDGDGFADPVLVQSAAYPPTEKYVGYSTPCPVIDDAGVFHLFFDVAQYSLPGVWRQVALGHATSQDGLAFAETETNLLTVGGGSWYDWEVRAPAPLLEGGSFKLWFAGTGRRSEVTSTGIGLATPNR